MSLWINVLDLVLHSLSENDLAKAGKTWKLVQWHMFNVREVADECMGTVRTIKAIKIHPFQTPSVHGITKVKENCMRVNLSADSRDA